MRRILSNWVFVFLIAVFVLVMMFYQSLFHLTATPPSKNWSRAVNIAMLQKSSSADYENTCTAILPLQDKKTFIVFWQDKHEIFYSVINKDGYLLHTGNINHSFPMFLQIGAVMQNGLIKLYGLTEQTLLGYEFVNSDFKICSQKTIAKGVTTFITKDNKLVYSTEQAVFIIDRQDQKRMISRMPAKLLNAVKAEDDLFYILVTSESPNWDVQFDYASYNEKTNVITSYKSLFVGIEHRCVLINSSFGVDVKNKSISLIEIVKKVETLDVFGMNICFPIGNTDKPTIHQLNITGFHPNPTVASYHNGVTEYIANAETKLGLTTSTLNLYLFKLKNGTTIGKERITKADGVSFTPETFLLGKDRYLVWEEIGVDSKSIRYAGTNTVLYEKSKALTALDYRKLVFRTITGCAGSLLLILLLSSITVLSAMAVLLVVSMLALNWAEANQDKLLNLCILVQFCINILFTLHTSETLYTIKPVLPVVLQTIPGLLIVVILATSVAAYCVKRRYYGRRNSSIFIQFLHFEVMNLVLNALIYYPYYSL